MNYLLDVLLFGLASAGGYWCFKKLKIPAPMILGPLVVIAVINMTGYEFLVSPWLKPLLSYFTGMLVGIRFNLKLKGLLKYVAVALAWLLLVPTLTAQMLSVAGLDRVTSLFTAFPGGLAEISLMSIDYGADTFAVALLQSSRLIATMLVIPLVLVKIKKSEEEIAQAKTAYNPASIGRIVPIAGLAAVGSVLLNIANFPSGILIGAMIGAGIWTRTRNIHLKINRTLQTWVQVFVGGLVGASINRASVLNIGHYIVPILVLNVLILSGSALLALFYHKMGKWSWPTCILAASPAGLSPTIMLSMEYNADSSVVTLFQVLRMVSVLIIVPAVALLIL